MPFTMFLERDATYDKCKHAIKVVYQTRPLDMTVVVKQFVMGYLPTDVSFNLAILMDENRGYFTVSVMFGEEEN